MPITRDHSLHFYSFAYSVTTYFLPSDTKKGRNGRPKRSIPFAALAVSARYGRRPTPIRSPALKRLPSAPTAANCACATDFTNTLSVRPPQQQQQQQQRTDAFLFFPLCGSPAFHHQISVRYHFRDIGVTLRDKPLNMTYNPPCFFPALERKGRVIKIEREDVLNDSTHN